MKKLPLCISESKHSPTTVIPNSADVSHTHTRGPQCATDKQRSGCYQTLTPMSRSLVSKIFNASRSLFESKALCRIVAAGSV